MIKRLFVDFKKPLKDLRYNSVNKENLEYFKGLATVLTENLDNYNRDYIGIYNGASRVVLKPVSTLAVQKIIKYCNEKTLPLCVQSGNTGLVGGSVPVYDEVILSLSAMSSVLDFDQDLGTVLTQSGKVLAEISSFCEEKGFSVPVDLGAKGSCMIGGNVATNAGGNRLIRYHSLKENVLSLTVVTGKGEILNCKDWLMQIFIGSEGSLGVITEVLLKVPKTEKSKNLALLTCKTFDNILQALKIAKNCLSEILSAYEFIDCQAYDLTSKYIPSFYPFFKEPAEFYVLVETRGSNNDHDLAKLEEFLEKVAGLYVNDGIIAKNLAEFDAIWNIRENCGPAASRNGLCLKYDISCPLSDYYKIVESVRKIVNNDGVTIGFGHVADGNVHINIAVHKDSLFYGVKSRVEKFLYQELFRIGGSISAEHGIGLQKVENLKNCRSLNEINVMVIFMQNGIKKIFDPNLILNPYKVIPIDSNSFNLNLNNK